LQAVQKILGVTGIVAGLVAGVAAAGTSPDPGRPGWRAVAEADLASVPAAQRPPGQRFAVSGDFDGDGKADRAWVMVSDKGHRYGLFVSRGGRSAETLADGDVSDLPNLVLALAKPGTYKTACAKGYGDDAQPCRRQVRARWTAIGFGSYESSDQIFFWDGKRFDSEFLSD